jgi:hypothetical protein
VACSGVYFTFTFTFADALVTLSAELGSLYLYSIIFHIITILYYHYLLEEIHSSRRTVYPLWSYGRFLGKEKPTLRNAIYCKLRCGQMLIQTIMWLILQSQFMLIHKWNCFRIGWNSPWQRTYGIGLYSTRPCPCQIHTNIVVTYENIQQDALYRLIYCYWLVFHLGHQPVTIWVNTTRYCKYSQLLLMMGENIARNM